MLEMVTSPLYQFLLKLLNVLPCFLTPIWGPGGLQLYPSFDLQCIHAGLELEHGVLASSGSMMASRSPLSLPVT